MDDDEDQDQSRGFLDSLKAEWKLLWASIEDDTMAVESSGMNNHSRTKEKDDLAFPATEGRIRALSHARQRLYQIQENLKREIDGCQMRIEQARGQGLQLFEEERYLELLLREGLELHDRIARLSDDIDVIRDRSLQHGRAFS